MEDNMEKILVSKKEAAAALGISLRTVENLIARKELDARRIGRRRLVPKASLEKLARRDVPSPALEAAEVRDGR
jgi:excisionase family DNA binding protein